MAASSLLTLNKFIRTFVWYGACGIISQFTILFWFGFTLQVSIIDSLVSIVLLGLACAIIINNLKYYRPEKNGFWFILSSCLILSTIWIFANHYALGFLLGNDVHYGEFLYKSIPVRFFIGLLIIGLMAMMSVLWYTQEDQKEAEQRKADAEKLARDAELYNLRQQLQPHFLFNSLNSITALIGNRPEEARNMIHQLSDFLRGTLKKEDQRPVSLSEELEHLALYLSIEKVRFGHRLTTEIITHSGCEDLLLPPMLLQPIVENAIKFGLYDTVGNVTIRILADCINKNLSVTIENPYDPNTSRPKHGTGFGLSGVKRRLDLLFGRNDLLQISAGTHIFTTTVTIPQY